MNRAQARSHIEVQGHGWRYKGTLGFYETIALYLMDQGG